MQLHNKALLVCIGILCVCMIEYGYKCLNIDNECKGNNGDHLLFWQPTISIILYVIALYLFFPY